MVEKNAYTILNKFDCYGIIMVTVKMANSASIMTMEEYNRICITERKWELNKNAA